MSSRNTIVRSMHDLGLAAWFGGSLMGAVALNGAANDITDEQDRARVAASGWARWAPVAAAAIGTHAVGGIGLIIANRGRIAGQAGVGANTAVKALLTGAAMGATAYSGVLGAKVAKAGRVPAAGGVIPGDRTPADVAGTLQQLRIIQWAIPALTAVLVVLAAQQGEQQKPDQVAAGVAEKAATSPDPVDSARTDGISLGAPQWQTEVTAGDARVVPAVQVEPAAPSAPTTAL